MQSFHALIRKLGAALLVSVIAALSAGVSVAYAAETWVETGQPGQGGLVRNVVTFNTTPDTTLYAAIYGSGIYRASANGGASWVAINNGLTNKFVNAIRNVTGTTHTNTTLYAVTDGGGIFRTSTGTVNWTPFNAGLNCLYVRNINVVNATLLYASTTCGVNSGVYRSSGPNASWVQLNTGANGMPSNVSVINMTADSTGQFLRAATDGLGVYYSGNGGSTWTQINGTSPNVLSGLNTSSIRVISGTDLAVVVEGGGVFRSSDNGANWVSSSSGLPSLVQIGGFSNISSAYYLSVPGYGLYRATNASAPWSPVSGSDNLVLPYSRGIFQSTTGTPYYSANLAGVYKSSGATLSGWTPIKTGLPGGDINLTATDPSNSNIVYAAADTIYKSTDGGATWVRSDTGFLGPALNVWLDFSNPSLLYATSDHYGVFRSTDAGATWVQSNSGLSSVAGQNTRVWIDRATPTRIYLSQEGGGGVYRSQDSGATWTNISGNLTGKGLNVRRVRNHPTDPNMLYAATDEGLYKTVNAGSTWTLVFQQVSPASITQSVNHVTFDPTNPDTVFIATKNSDAFGVPFSFSGVWKSTNGGSNWTQVLSNHVVHNMAVVGGGTSPLIVYAGSHNQSGGGILRSVDGGTNWSVFNTGLANTLVHSFERNSTYTQLLRASTYGGTYSLSGGVDGTVLNNVQAALETFRNVVNTQGANLDYTHLYPAFYDAGYLDEGNNALADAKHLASELRGWTINSITINKVNSYDAASGVIDVAVTLVTNMGTFVIDSTVGDSGGFVLKDQGGGIYKSYGNQQLARVQANFETENRQTGQTCPSGCDGTYYFTQFQADAPAGTVTAVTVDGPNYSNSSLVFSGTQSETIQPSPPPASGETVNRDYFQLMPGQSPTLNFPPPGSLYTFTVTPATGPQQQITRTVAPWTTETISITSPTSHALAAANLGGSLTVNWTLPTTFTVREIFIYVNTSSSAGTCNNALNFDNVPPNSTSFTIPSMPTQCLGQPIADGAQTYPVNINVAVRGTNGEATRAWYTFGSSVCTGNSGPTNLIATGVVQTQVQLQWDRACMPTTIANYGVYRGTTPGGPYTFIGNPVNPNTSTVYFNDTTVSPSTTYYYVVNATDVAANVSAYSNELAVTTPSCSGDCISPSIPTNVVATAVGPTQVNLTWTASTDNVGVTRYQIGRDGVYINSNAPNATTYSDFTARPGTTYTYFVSACDAAGNCSVGSDGSMVTTPSGTSAKLYTVFSTPPGVVGSNSIRQGQTEAYRAVLVKADGTIVDPVAATWSITSGPATVNSSGVVTGGAVSANTTATLVASFTDATLTNGVTLTNTRTLTIQASQDHWTGGISPAQGGDVRSITVAGSAGTDLVAGIYGGGIRRSSNGGTNWVQSGYGLPGFGGALVRNVRTIPGTSNVQMLAAVEGQGIFRSTTSGANWAPSNTGMGCDFPRGFSVSVTSGVNTFYVTADCGVYKSSDNGLNWTATTLTQPIASVLALNNSTTVWALDQGTGGLYRSLDGGASWSQMNTGLPAGPNGLRVLSLQIQGSTYLTLVEGAGVYRGTNNGASWSAENSGLPASYGFQGGIGFQGGDGYFYVSVDGYGLYRGTTGASTSNPMSWSPWGSTATQLPMRSGTPSLINGAYYVRTGQGIYKSTDAGTTWTKINSGLPGGFVRNSATDPTNTNIVYATADTVYKSTDGGTTWALANNGVTGPVSGTRFSGASIHVASDGALYTSTGDAGIFKSTNAGASWFPINSGLPAVLGQGVSVRADPTDAQTLYALFGNDPYGIYKTVNGGTSWTSINGDLPAGNARYVNGIGVDPATGYLYIGTDAGLYKSINGGTNWTAVYTAQPVNVARVDDGTNPSTVYWATYVADSFNVPQAASGVYKTTDGGATYSQVLTGHLVQNFRALRPGGQLVLYVASWNAQPAGGVLRSTNGGTSWETVTAGINNVFVSNFDPVNEQIMHAATRGNGVFSFVPDQTGQPPAPVLSTPGLGAQSQVGLAWNAVTGATSYNIYRRVTPSGTYSAIATGYTGPDSYFYFVDTTVVGGTAYEYYMTAVNGSGESAPSNVVAVTTAACPGADCTSPSVVTNLVATAVGPNQVNLSWTASTDASGINHYRIGRCLQNQSNTCTGIDNTVGAPTNYTDYTAMSNTAYYYWVLAIDNAGNISVTTSSGAANVTTPASGSSGAALYISASTPPGIVPSDSIRQGQSATFRAVLVQVDGTIVDPVAATWSLTSGPATVNGSGVVTGGAVSVNTPATLQASFTDATLTAGATLTANRTLTIQASQDRWTGGIAPAQGGDVRSITVAGSAGTDLVVAIYGGGIRRSSNGGTNWVQSGFGLPGRGAALVRNVRTIPGTNNVHMLAAVEGEGIFRSTTSGANWAPSNSGMGCDFPRGFGISTTTGANTIYVASDCGLYKSSDNGLNWSITGLTQPISSVTAFNNSSTVWALDQGTGGLYRSTDGGATWAQRNSGLPVGPNGLRVLSLQIQGSTYLALVEGAGVYRGTNSGASWSAENSGLPPAYGFQGGIGFQGGDGYFYVSVDGYGIYRGTTGANTSNPVTWSGPWGSTATQLPMRSATPALISGAYYVRTGQGIYKSSDNGANWTKINSGLPGGFVRNSTTDPTNTNIVYATADTVYKSTDGGTTWALANSGITGAVGGSRGSGGSINRASDGAWYTSTGDAGIFKSTNGAASWFPINSGLPALLGQGISVRPDPTNAQTLYALFGNDPYGIYKSVNGGASWTSISTGLTGNALYVNGFAVDTATGHLYIGTDAGLYKSSNGGASWTATAYTAQSVNSVRVDTGTSPSTVYWSTYVPNNFNVPQTASGLYKSADGGATYSQILTGHLVQNFRGLRPGGQLVLYVASWNAQPAGGVLRSTNGGTSWETIIAGINNVFVSNFDPVNEQIMHASTRGNGVFTFVSAAPPPPPAPTGVSATPYPDGSIQMSWNAVSGATSYNVYMATASGVTKANYLSLGGHAHTGITATTYTHPAGAAAGTTYFIVVTAVGASGESVESGQVAATIPTDTTPDAFSFAPQSNVAVNSVVTSNAITVSGINAPAAISVAGGSYSIGCGATFTTTAGTITNGQSVCVRHTAAATASTPTSTTLTIGGVSATFTSTTASGTPIFTPVLERNWNMLGNALNITLDVATVFGGNSNIASVWKWDASTQTWAYYSPALTADQLIAFTTSRAYQVLASIGPGEGYWVNALNAITLPVQTGAAFYYNFANFAALPSSWNLIATSDPYSPHAFSNAMIDAPPPTGGVNDSFFSLWAWDAVRQNWYYYSPALENTGSPKCGLPCVKSYTDARGLLHFEDYEKTLGLGVGFWVNRR